MPLRASSWACSELQPIAVALATLVLIELRTQLAKRGVGSRRADDE